MARCFGVIRGTRTCGINVSQPIVVDQNRFFISSGYGKGAALVEVKGSGNSFTAIDDLGKQEHEEQVQ